MNTPNPLVPQGTFKDKGKSHVRITVFAILAIHVVLLGALLIAGCNKKSADQAQDNGLPPVPPPPTDAVWPAPPTSPAPAAVTQDVAGGPPATPAQAENVAPSQALTPQPPPADVAGQGFSEHTIAKGESFYTLGKKYNVGFKAIADANPGINPNRLKIGDKVKIPPPKSPNAASVNGAAAAATGDGATKIYTVKSGDNLLKIAKIYGVTPKQLRSENNLRTDQIKVGQKLKIPVKAPTPPPIEATSPPPAVPTAPPPGFPSPAAQ